MIVCGWSFFAQGFLKQRKICFFRIGLSHFYVTFVLLGNRTNDGNSAKKIFHRQYSTLQRQDVCCGTRHHRLAGRCRRCRADSDVTDMGEHLQRNISRSAGSILSFTESARASRKIPLDTTREIPTGDGGTEKAIELNEVTATLRRLPEKERKAVEMSAFAGCSADDIAEVLGVSAVNARQILSRGRRRLRSFFH